jgi:cold shock protein
LWASSLSESGFSELEDVRRNNPDIMQHSRKIALPLQQIILINTKLMNQGTVKFFNDSKGYGFIVDNNTQKEYFTHVSGLIDEIREGDEVTFEIEEGRKGLNAVNVQLA